ncbi:RNA polymerase sigma factor [Elusimicrobiota bacterium]
MALYVQTEHDCLTQDLMLIRRSAAGDQHAFRELVEKHHGNIYNLCLSITASTQDAEDLTQETFLKAHARLSDFRPGKKFSSWLYSIALNKCRNLLRRRKIVRFVSFGFVRGEDVRGREIDPPDTGPSIEAILERREMETLISKLVRKLPEQLKEVFMLHHVRRIPEREIADILGISLNNVRVRICRAKEYLWKEFSGTIGSGV